MTVWPIPYTTQLAISDVKISLSDKEKVRSVTFIFQHLPAVSRNGYTALLK
jgi:hypothetical protein